MNSALTATLTQTYRRDPLAVVDGLPGSAAELTPAQLRMLANALTRIAADCEARPLTGKHLMTVKREYPLQSMTEAPQPGV